MNRREILSLSGALAAAALAGCAGDGDPATTTSETPTETTTTTTASPGAPTAETPPSGEPRAPDERLAELAAGNAAFALDLHRAVANEQGGNVFLSPYSVSVALAMTYAGAEGETRDQMRETLHYALDEQIHPAFADLQAALEERETTTDPTSDEAVDAFALAVANALWGREGFAFADDYLSLLEQHYGAGLRRADFVNDPDGERERINQWVADNTEGRVERLLPPTAISPATVLVLTNAIFFKASWLKQFDPENTADGTFTALSGSTSTVPFMEQELRTPYASLPNAQAVELPYVGREVSMVLLLPDEGAFESFERSLSPERLFGIFEALGDAEGRLALPKFEYRTKVRLSKTLSELGMPVAFESGADFGGMVEGDDAGLWISEVFHEAFVTVDEEGTEAAAATAVEVVESLPPQWGTVRFDRPFLFCIRDRPTDAVLFLGRVVDAGSAQPQS